MQPKKSRPRRIQDDMIVQPDTHRACPASGSRSPCGCRTRRGGAQAGPARPLQANPTTGPPRRCWTRGARTRFGGLFQTRRLVRGQRSLCAPASAASQGLTRSPCSECLVRSVSVGIRATVLAAAACSTTASPSRRGPVHGLGQANKVSSLGSVRAAVKTLADILKAAGGKGNVTVHSGWWFGGNR